MPIFWAALPLLAKMLDATPKPPCRRQRQCRPPKGCPNRPEEPPERRVAPEALEASGDGGGKRPSFFQKLGLKPRFPSP